MNNKSKQYIEKCNNTKTNATINEKNIQIKKEQKI